MFFGRDKELQFFEDRYNSEDAQLIVLYGRRRVGKTEFLKAFAKDKPHVFFSCAQTLDAIQLAKFSQTMFKEDIPLKKYLKSFSDWEQAFSSVLDLPYGEQKKLLIIDEFPYMCNGNKSIPSILQNLWDHVLKDSNVMIILCGSAMSFIERELLAEKNPLYGRATGIYKMKEMGFYDAIKFFPNYSPMDKVLSYAILGGIPYYLKQWDDKLTLEENIKQHILSKGSILYSEVEFLLHQELRETPIYNSIIEAVALGNTKLNDISQKSLIGDTAKTSVYLKNLVELGIVVREFSVDTQVKQQANSSRGFYRLADNFFKFWYAFCFGNYSDLEYGDVHGVFKYAIEPQLNKFASIPFEDICKDFLRELQIRHALPFRFTNLGRWFGKSSVRDGDKIKFAETEIDILATNVKENKYLVGECKFKSSPLSYGDYLDTTAKLSTLKENGNFYYAFFSKSGFDERLLVQPNTLLFTLEDIVNLKEDKNTTAQ